MSFIFVLMVVSLFSSFFYSNYKVSQTFGKKLLNGFLNFFEDSIIKLFKYPSNFDSFLKTLIHISVASSSSLCFFIFSMIIGCLVALTVIILALYYKYKFICNKLK